MRPDDHVLLRVGGVARGNVADDVVRAHFGRLLVPKDLEDHLRGADRDRRRGRAGVDLLLDLCHRHSGARHQLLGERARDLRREELRTARATTARVHGGRTHAQAPGGAQVVRLLRVLRVAHQQHADRALGHRRLRLGLEVAGVPLRERVLGIVGVRSPTQDEHDLVLHVEVGVVVVLRLFVAHAVAREHELRLDLPLPGERERHEVLPERGRVLLLPHLDREGGAVGLIAGLVERVRDREALLPRERLQTEVVEVPHQVVARSGQTGHQRLAPLVGVGCEFTHVRSHVPRGDPRHPDQRLLLGGFVLEGGVLEGGVFRGGVRRRSGDDDQRDGRQRHDPAARRGDGGAFHRGGSLLTRSV